ncbi:MAG: peptidase domain-containing ABC transporter [Rhodospirillales bacterium]|nr:peptidase domain-containing ABC transporter [Alphaproteobacteria bacterium]MBL6948790.1 peptidase domain-containing ABC transporter [Rhodospirillales bacterium]
MPGGFFDAAVATVFINVLGLAVPLALLQLFDRVIPEKDASRLFWLIVGVGSALILDTLLRIGRSYVSGWMGARLEHRTGCNALQRLFRANIVDFEKRGAGAYLERLNALSALREFYAGPAVAAFFDLPFVVLYLGAILTLAGPLVLVPVLLIAVFSVSSLLLGKLREALNMRMLADDRRFGFIIEVLGGIHTVKGLGMEQQMLRRYERLQESSAEEDFRVTRFKGTAAGAGILLSGLVVFATAGFGALLVIGGSLTIGGLLAAILLAGRATQPLETIAATWARYQDMKLARERLGEIFEMEAEKLPGLMQLAPIKGSLDFEGVTFSYGRGKDGEDLPAVFRDVNLRVEPGQTIGIVGPSASGKTTLLSLMMGLYTPTSGTVRVDGFNLRECDTANIHHQVAYLPQEGVMFGGTLLENLTMFRDERTDDALGIARLLGLDNVAQTLANGYDTIIGVGAEDTLPRGTRQRIAIARAMVDKPKILLFDEANSFIDGPGDAMLLDLLAKLKGRVTTILVTQRPSMLRLADRLLEIRDDTLFEHDLTQKRAGAGKTPGKTPGSTGRAPKDHPAGAMPAPSASNGPVSAEAAP